HPGHAAARGLGVQQRRPALHAHRRRTGAPDHHAAAVRCRDRRPVAQLRLRGRAHHGGIPDPDLLLRAVPEVEQVRGAVMTLTVTRPAPPRAPQPPPPTRQPGPQRPARWQVYLPLGLYLPFTLVPVYRMV